MLTQNDLEQIGELVNEIVERRLRPVRDKLHTLLQEDRHMDQQGEALKQAIETLNGETSATHAAVEAAGTKFVELKALIEKQASGVALSDTEAQELTTLTGEVGTHLTEAATELQTDTSAA